MPKHKKTREQKKKADAKISTLVHSSAQTIPTGMPTYTLSSENYVAKSASHSIHTVDTQSLIRHDLLKTLFISAAIVTLQLFFFFLLKNHVLAINFVRY